MKNDDTNEHLNRLLKTQDIEYVIAPDVGDPLDPFRGLMWGLVICIPVWVVLGFVIWSLS